MPEKKKTNEDKDDGNTNVKGLEDSEIRGQVKTNKISIKIGQNTEVSPGDVRRLVYAGVKNSQRVT